jgi:hypothetical protein
MEQKTESAGRPSEALSGPEWYEIPSCNLERLEARLGKLQKAARKLGQPEIQILSSGAFTRIEQKRNPFTGKPVKFTRDFWKIQITGEAPLSNESRGTSQDRKGKACSIRSDSHTEQAPGSQYQILTPVFSLMGILSAWWMKVDPPASMVPSWMEGAMAATGSPVATRFLT